MDEQKRVGERVAYCRRRRGMTQSEVARYNVLAREIVRTLLGRERKSRMIGLRGLAERMGVNA